MDTIFQVRRNKVEAPKADVTRFLEEQNNFVDCRSDVLPVKKSGPIATCRYPATLFRIYVSILFYTRFCTDSLQV